MKTEKQKKSETLKNEKSLFYAAQEVTMAGWWSLFSRTSQKNINIPVARRNFRK